MARYKLHEKAFIDNKLYEAGEVVEVSDSLTPGSFMEPMDAAAKKRAKEVGLVLGAMDDPIDRLTATSAESVGGSPQDVKSGMAVASAYPAG
jgi:hypothetical protein